MAEPFYFKQFTVHQDRCAMKVGTDGVLLGAWTTLQNSLNSILDVGAGTGLIALMVAQRCNAPIIDAIELDADAHCQCAKNFEASPWRDRLRCYHSNFIEFAKTTQTRYDVVISNPPFHTENTIISNYKRDRARRNSSLPFDSLFEGVEKILSKTGKFAIILPARQEQNSIGMASSFSLFPHRITRIRGNKASKVKRCLLEFSRTKTTTETSTLTIETERHRYTKAYVELTRDFYWKL